MEPLIYGGSNSLEMLLKCTMEEREREREKKPDPISYENCKIKDYDWVDIFHKYLLYQNCNDVCLKRAK